MPRIVGPWIDDGHLALAQQVSVRSGACHHARIAGHDAAQASA